jgi:hypothetical protein
LSGFVLAVVASFFSWSRFGGYGAFGAWTFQWSLAASVAGALGLILTVVAWIRPPRITTQVAAYAILASAVILATVLHRLRPPPLTTPSPAVWLCLAGGMVALAGATWMALSARRSSG